MVSEGGQESSAASSPIYISWLTFMTLLDWLRDMKVLPTQFDRSLWQGKFSGSVGGQIPPGLRFLGLLDGDRITPELERLALANTDERKPLLLAMLKRAYGEDLITQLPRFTPKMLNERLEALGTTDGTHRKALSFFVNAAKAVDLQMPGNIAKSARNRPSVRKPGAGRARNNGTTGAIGTNGSTERDGEGTPSPVSRAGEEAPRQPALALHAVLNALLKDLEQIGPKWTKDERKRWLQTFQMNLDYAYPAKAADGTVDAGGDEYPVAASAGA